ncbi:prion-inhibition and propagation-domain-containing protein [Stachybotrys elegans]|uniref:Prion-inhibition and propagation-domain-containing protein n=1 Tax=Stachybotrys elegans TaxID=80388 RepID=A0A8K0WL65_9HYPO|nr:prion-inhibition and propagation-domain-containing protein [Stachybotrys elegans]
MEAAGLAVGILTLVGIFDDCVTLFSYFTSYRSLGRDYEVLAARLDVEKTLLLQWAARVRLLYHDHDSRLDDAATQNAVSIVLGNIHSLLGEGSIFQERYGMEQPPQNAATLEVVKAQIGQEYMEVFRKYFHAFQLRVKGRQKYTSSGKKFRWAVNDKGKFEKLVQELSNFVAKLNHLIPSINPAAEQITQTMLRETLSHLKDLRALRATQIVPIHAPVRISRPAKEPLDTMVQKRILERLWFRTMDDRLEAVSAAHQKTFRWALSPDSDLSSWLASGSGIFWVSGKAGSGKSTLMKYLFHHSDTSPTLQQWARDNSIILGAFFFWNLGTLEQKSHTGLCRAILYQLLTHNRSLLPKVLPRMWKQGCACNTEENDLELLPPTDAELQSALTILLGMELPQYFCFLIDGLDEYEGKLSEGITFIQNLASTHRIKVVLSSRPLPLCVDAFSSNHKIRLQDITRPDIEAYVGDLIGSHNHFLKLKHSQPNNAQSIIDQLVEKSAGVFLWVILACRNVLNGFAAYDTIAEIMQRVDELPQELEDMFRHMLKKVEPRYAQNAAKMLRICYQNQVHYNECGAERLNLRDKFARRERVASRKRIDGWERVDLLARPWDILDRYCMEFENAPSFELITHGYLDEILPRVEGRLRSRCGGLLELTTLLKNKEKSHIVFMHRTVFEFLSLPGIWELDCLAIHDARFNAMAAISFMSMYLWYAKPNIHLPPFREHAIRCCVAVDEQDVEWSFPLLKRMTQILVSEEVKGPGLDPTRPSHQISEHGIGNFLLALALEVNMTAYVSRHTPQPDYRPPVLSLSHALGNDFLTSPF